MKNICGIESKNRGVLVSIWRYLWSMEQFWRTKYIFLKQDITIRVSGSDNMHFIQSKSLEIGLCSNLSERFSHHGASPLPDSFGRAGSQISWKKTKFSNRHCWFIMSLRSSSWENIAWSVLGGCESAVMRTETPLQFLHDSLLLPPHLIMYSNQVGPFMILQTKPWRKCSQKSCTVAKRESSTIDLD